MKKDNAEEQTREEQTPSLAIPALEESDFSFAVILHIAENRDVTENCTESMCFVNNSIFEIAVPEITEIKKRLQIGFEFCYDAISYPQSYDLMRASNRNYTYFSEERYSFL